ncbi:MAG: enoyl-CoA hydratase/isomerase family protein [Pseudomonadota bacterium]
MSCINFEIQESVAVVTMANGENRQNPSFAEAMLDALAAAEAEETVRAIILTSSDEKNWSQGVDLAWMMEAQQKGDEEAIRSFMYGMNKVFARLLTISVPTIAAINGHAFGNGAMLACSCDFRFMRSDRGYFCFPEVDINIPFMPSMIGFVRKAIPEYLFNELKLTGRRATAPELEEDKVLVAACADRAATFETAMDFAKTFDKGRGIFGEHKRRMHKSILATMENEDRPLIESLTLTA